MLVYSDFVLVVPHNSCRYNNICWENSCSCAVAEYLSCDLGSKWEVSELKNSSSKEKQE